MATELQHLQPYLKWAGGKRQLLPEIRKYIPKEFNTYYEAFVGAGAVLFDLKHNPAVISDVNTELIETYKVIQNDVGDLIKQLKVHQKKHNKDYYYKIRHLDRNKEDFNKLSQIEKSARLIYLNKTCFNGLFRVNSKGEFNVPCGKYAEPNIVNEDVLKDVHQYLSQYNVTILNADYKEAVKNAKKGDFVYFDPPYDPVSDTSSFTSYSMNGFSKENQEELYQTFIDLDKEGCYVMLSNSATDFIKNLYKEYDEKGFLKIVSASRSINSKATKRGKIDEVLVMNYEPDRQSVE